MSQDDYTEDSSSRPNSPLRPDRVRREQPEVATTARLASASSNLLQMLADAADEKEVKDSGAPFDFDSAPKRDELVPENTELEPKDAETLWKHEDAAPKSNEAVPENGEALLTIEEDMVIDSPDVTAGRNMDMLESFMSASDSLHVTGKSCGAIHFHYMISPYVAFRSHSTHAHRRRRRGLNRELNHKLNG